MFTYTRHMFLTGEVKVVQFLLKTFQNLTVSGHVGGQYEGDDCLKTKAKAKMKNEILK